MEKWSSNAKISKKLPCPFAKICNNLINALWGDIKWAFVRLLDSNCPYIIFHGLRQSTAWRKSLYFNKYFIFLFIVFEEQSPIDSKHSLLDDRRLVMQRVIEDRKGMKLAKNKS